MIRIVLVDDHDLFRAGVRSILQTQEGMVVVGEYSNGEDVVKAVPFDEVADLAIDPLGPRGFRRGEQDQIA